jgi:hypothetical protein
MTQENMLKLAKQGNPKALAVMLNQSLQPKGITAMVSYIHNGLIKLEVESIKTVKVYGRQTGDESSAWSQKFELVSQQETPSSTEPTEFKNLLSNQTLHKSSRAVPPKVETSSSTRQTDFQNPKSSIPTSKNPNLHQATGPLSVGNVVSTGLVLYRSHLKSYFGIALLASLWTLLPVLLIIPLSVLFFSRILDLSTLLLVIPIWLVLFIYCLAKYIMNAALISRLGFYELISKPENVKTARSQVNPRLWAFVRLVSLAVPLGLVVYFVLAIIAGIIGGIMGYILSFVTPLLGTITSSVITVIIILAGIIWIYSRLLVVETVLAVEDRGKVFESISRSWQLTKASGFRIIGVVLVAFLVTLPIVFLTGYLPQILLIAVKPASTAFWTLNLISTVLSFVIGALVMPFWQALKAVVYYDLRSRREGLGLQLRDSSSQ